jgi:uncharacterized protein YggE
VRRVGASLTHRTVEEATVSVRRRLAQLFALLAFAGAVAAAGIVGASDPVRAAPAEPPPGAGVRVQGVGTATGTPDVLHVTIGVEVGEPSVADALESAGTAANRVLGALREAGVPEDDVRTANVHVYPRYDGDGQRITGYLAGQDLAVTLRDLDAAGATISSAVGAAGDAARLQGVSYELDDDVALQEQARELAFADARRRAEQYAQLAGRELGEVVLMREQVTMPGPVPMAAGDAVAASEAVPIAPGSADVTVTAEIRWALI